MEYSNKFFVLIFIIFLLQSCLNCKPTNRIQNSKLENWCWSDKGYLRNCEIITCMDMQHFIKSINNYCNVKNQKNHSFTINFHYDISNNTFDSVFFYNDYLSFQTKECIEMLLQAEDIKVECCKKDCSKCFDDKYNFNYVKYGYILEINNGIVYDGLGNDVNGVF